MKKIMITCALIASGSMMSYAQNAQTPASPMSHPANQPTAEQIAERHTKMYEKQLGLSKEQCKTVYEAELTQVKQQMSMSANNVPPNSGAAMQANMAKDQKMKTILTPEQFTKYQATAPKMMPPTPHAAGGASAPVNH